MFSIHWSRSSEKTLDKLQKDISKRIVHKIHSLKEDPFRYLEHYHSQDCYKIRIGEYRALIDVNYSKMLLEVRLIGHRKKIYKKK